jgi:lipopolysaccharide transport system permease protein
VSGALIEVHAREGATPASPPPDSLLVIEAPRGGLNLQLGELWRYRELLGFLAWRDVKIRYKQTALGAAWAVLQPLLAMLVFSIFFGRLAGLENKTGGVPYPIYVYAGLLPWIYFANAITASSSSLVGSAGLITKVYFPRLIVPLAAVGAGLVDFAVSGAVLLVLMAWYSTPITWQLLSIPLFLAGTILTATGVGSLLSALTVKYRDFRYVIPFMVQIWMFATPVVYPSRLIPERWQWAVALNPMAGLIDGFRAAFLGRPFDWRFIALSLGVAALLFVVGTLYFQRVERSFADVI